MKDIQATELNRYRNNITAHKVIKVDRSNVKIALPWGDETTFPIMNDTLDSGDWIDLQIREKRVNGTVSDYSISYIGRTPERFIPKN